jgi:parallel beta-helix repeat protein
MPRLCSLFRTLGGALAALALGSAASSAATLYADGQIASASCTNYSPASRTCGAGTDRAYRTLSGAASAAAAGDTVYLRAGTFSEQLVPARSGTAGQPITFAAYPGESPRISGVSNPALWLVQRSYIVVDGLTVSNVGGWGRLEDASHNVIRNGTFTAATIQGTTGGLKLVRSTYNKILDNTFEDGNDNVTIQESDRNVFQGNTVSTGRHSLLSLRCGNYNVVRGNTFSNPEQKDLEIYDCEGTSDAPVKLDATKRNLVEGNVIADTAPSGAAHDYNGIQFAGQQGIVRRNVFRDDMGGGINFQFYSDESLYNNRNRVYHNTFYGNRCFGIAGASGDSRFYDNRARNNVLYKNTSCSGSGSQVSIANTSQVILSDNALATTSPGFVDEAGRDFHLASGSPMIDAGAFLTTATAAGSGTRITVADASYFFDGYGIPEEQGDEVQLQGQGAVARVTAVDLATNTLTLDRALTWTAGQGVSLRYGGAKPDLGAFESGAAAQPELSVGDVTLTEGHSGTTAATFTVALSVASTQTVTVSYATADGTATAGSDYAAASGSLTFAPGTTSKAVAVSVSGDTVPEGDETFFLNLANPTGAAVGDSQGRATIRNDDALASSLSIGDGSTTEGNSGTKTLGFTVTLSPASASTVTVSYATASGTATAGSDFVAQTGSLTFAAGETSRTIAIVVNGDTAVEPNETFLVSLSGASGATLADGQATGTILNDDQSALALSINDVTVTEGDSGTRLARFTVSLSGPSASAVTVGWATVDGTATAGSDYFAGGGTLSFPAGQTSATISVAVAGDTTAEANESFLVRLSAAAGATVADAVGLGTITNDDSPRPRWPRRRW